MASHATPPAHLVVDVPTLELSAGSKVAGYRIEALAGRGGMGVVYRATQLALKRPVALKLIAPDLADDDRFRERFKRESLLAASIDHPNVIPIYEAGETEGSLFISMRWVEGTDLQTLIRRGGGLEPERAARIVSQIADALDAAHERGLVHRDVKPANVLIASGRYEHVYLTDFGLVKRIAGSGDITKSGEFVGTIDYIAPEQIQGKGSNASSDVYSLGCVFFHALTGRVPFETDSEIAKIYAHLNATPPSPSTVVAGLPDEVDTVVTRAMDKDLDGRYKSAGDLGRAAVEASGVTRGAETVALAGAGLAERGSRRRAALWSMAALVLAAGAAALLALGGVFGSGGSGDAKRSAAVDPTSAPFLQARGGHTIYVVKAGAKFELPGGERSAFGYKPRSVLQISSAELRKVPNIPREGSVVKSYGSTITWGIADRQRVITTPRGRDVAVLPSKGLDQIPVARGGRTTSIKLLFPSVVSEGQPFYLRGRVSANKGTPKGACVFYRIANPPVERANTPTNGGRCKAQIRITGVSQVRYSMHFLGARGWRTSKTSTPAIQVLAK